MAISFQCPSCSKPYKVKDELAGKKAACTQCKVVMTVPRPTVSAEESQAVEALATAALVEESKQHEALTNAPSSIKVECEFCFEPVEYPLEKAGKKSPCPSCRRIVTVPVPATGAPKKDWREVKDNITMARKSDENAPEGAWGNAQLQKQVVSREALMEAKVIVHRRELMAPDRSKLYIGLAAVALACGIGGFFVFRGKAEDDRRHGLVVDATKASPSLPLGWPAAVACGAGEFYLHEKTPDLKSALKHLQEARSAIRQVESAVDRTGLLATLVQAQAELVGDEAKIDAKRALEWDSGKRELRQTLQIAKEIPRDDGWLVLETLTRKLGSIGQKQPLIIALAPEALANENDRADAQACVALTLLAMKDPLAEKIADNVIQSAATDVGPRLIALFMVRNQLAKARQIMPEPTGEDVSLAARMAYSEGYARAGDLDKARKTAMLNGTVEHKAVALAMLADAAVETGDTAELQNAVAFFAEQGKTFTLSASAAMRLGRACARAGRADLARQLADNVKLPAMTPWLELAALQAELKSTSSSLDPVAVKAADKSIAQSLAWIALARHNAKVTRGDPRPMLSAWPNDYARTAGAIGAALGVQERK